MAVVDPPIETPIVTAAAPVPLRLKDWGEFAELSVIVNVVVRIPDASGEKTSEIVQEAFATIAPLQVSAEIAKSEELNPPSTALKI